ncbi:MAG: hypothetical protein DLM50_02875 [Candidatus Meridianibacter frigidus]|nr:MAG: hypothetical protein DLM50_02875 [Candidatus Eremiobacteraeota bacterium]
MKTVLAILGCLSLTASAVRADGPADIKRNFSLCRGTLGSVQAVGGRALVLPSRGVNLTIRRSRVTGNERVVFVQQSTAKKAAFSISAGGHIMRIKNVVVRNLHVRPPVFCVLPD